MMIAALLLAATVSVHADRPQSFNGYTEIQGVFNANFNGEGGDSPTEQIRALELNGARLFLNYMGNWIAYTRKWPAENAKDPKRLTDAERRAMWKAWLDLPDAFVSISNAIARSRGGQDFTMKAVTRYGITNHVAFHMTIGSAVDTANFPAESCRFLKAETDAIVANNPALKGRDNWFFFECEPNYGHWAGRFETTYDAVSAWIRQYDNLEAFAEKEIPDFKISGPCVASGNFFTREGYRQWGSRVVRDVKNPMTRFVYNAYYIGPMSHFSWFSMLQNEAENARGVRPRGTVAENNHCTWWSDHAGERSKWFIQQLFMLLENPDKWDGVSVHMGAFRGQCSDLMVPDKADPRNWKWKLTELGEHFMQLRDLRGTNLHVANHDGTLKAFAALKSPQLLTLAVYNPTTRRRTFEPRLKGLTGAVTGVRIRSIHCRDTARVAFDERQAAALADAYALEPDEMLILGCSLDRPQALGAPVCQRDFYGQDTGDKTILAPWKTTVPGPKALPTRCRAFLRLGVVDADLLYSRGFTVRFNGRPLKLRYADAPREPGVFLCTYHEFPLDGIPVRPSNDLAFEDLENQVSILFASLVVREELEEVRPPHVPKIGALFAPPGRTFYGDVKESALESGSRRMLTLVLDNTEPTPAVYDVRLTYTPGLEGPAARRVSLKPDSRKVVDLPLVCKGQRAATDECVTATVSCPGRETVMLTTARLKSKPSDRKSIEEKEL